MAFFFKRFFRFSIFSHDNSEVCHWHFTGIRSFYMKLDLWQQLFLVILYAIPIYIEPCMYSDA